ncbi:MAG: HD domain-containing protein [Clostridiales bacterium]|nr:HD domain-containing protein [Clostridiales bacterium]
MTTLFNDVPTIKEAEALLLWAEEQNPGLWVSHVKTAARAASTIAGHCGMDRLRCYTLGLLHDVGRYEGKSALRHTIAGYDLMMSKGWGKAAAICLTHSFPLPEIRFYNGKNDCSEQDTWRICQLLNQIEYDDEIRLVQLCDAISLPSHVTIMEKRLIEVALRHGVTPNISEKWRRFLELKDLFDQKCGQNIYHLFKEEISKDLFSLPTLR